jgi:hypothetical protein
VPHVCLSQNDRVLLVFETWELRSKERLSGIHDDDAAATNFYSSADFADSLTRPAFIFRMTQRLKVALIARRLACGADLAAVVNDLV